MKKMLDISDKFSILFLRLNLLAPLGGKEKVKNRGSTSAPLTNLTWYDLNRSFNFNTLLKETFSSPRTREEKGGSLSF